MSTLKVSMLVRKMSKQLPSGMGFLKLGDRYAFPINDEEGKAVSWNIYLQKAGRSKHRPALNSVAGYSAGIYGLGEGWAVGKIVIPAVDIANTSKMIWDIQRCIEDLQNFQEEAQ